MHRICILATALILWLTAANLAPAVEPAPLSMAWDKNFLTIRGNARGLTHVGPSAIQDVAKLTFALCVMWMYFFFSQYLVIWYGNVPVETRFFLRRFFDDPWRTMAFVIFVVGWLIPFSYLLKRLTGRPPTAHKPLVVILFMGWVAIFFERVLLVYPAIYVVWKWNYEMKKGAHT